MKNRIFNFKKHNLINQRRQLALLVERFTERDGLQSTAIPSLDFIRASNISEPLHSLYAPSLCVIVQGTKMVILGKESCKYLQDAFNSILL